MADTAIQAVLFDLDDTLYDRREASRRRIEWFVDTQLPVPDGSARQEMIELLVTLDNNGYGSKEGIFQAIGERLPQIRHRTDELLTIFVEGLVEHLTLPEGTRTLLDALQRDSIPFGIVTNAAMADTQMRKVVKLGLDTRTDCVLISSMVGCKKPDAQIFLAAASQMGVTPEQILFVGDHCENDITGAHGAGMKTAWLKQEQQWPEGLGITPDYVLESLTDVAPILNLDLSATV